MTLFTPFAVPSNQKLHRKGLLTARGKQSLLVYFLQLLGSCWCFPYAPPQGRQPSFYYLVLLYVPTDDEASSLPPSKEVSPLHDTCTGLSYSPESGI